MTPTENLTLNHTPTNPTAATDVASPFSESVFLMINSLETGGTERQFVEMASALDADRVPVHLGCVHRTGAFAGELGEVAEFRLGGSLFGWQSLRSRWRLSRRLRRLDVAVAHSFDFYTNLTLIPAAKLAGVPVVIGSHRQIGDLLTASQFQAQLAAFRLCDRVVCNSHAAAERLMQAGIPGRKIAVIGNALPDGAFAAVPPARERTAGMLRVGMIARMNAEYKNHRGFLRAAKVVSEQFSNTEFILVGDGPLRGELENESAALGLKEKVIFLGDRRDIAAILASLDISVVASESESLSNVMLESMAAGVPVVATAVGGNLELGDQGRAVLVASKDDRALADGIIRLLDDRASRVETARAARSFAQASFSVGRICRQYEELYAETLRQKHRRREGRDRRVSPGADGRTISRTRVAFVAPSLRYVGGQSVQADLLLRHWRGDAEIEGRFVAVDPQFPFGLRWAGRVPFLRTVIRAPLYAWNLWRELKDVDVAHIFSASYSSFLLAPLPAFLIARLRGKKTIINYRSGEARDHLQHSWLARRVLTAADRLVVPSGYLVEVFAEFGLHAQVVPNIVDLSQFHYRERGPLRPHLICTRGFHSYYGIDVVVRAFAEAQKEYPEARLDLVGGGALESSIRDLVRQLHLSGVNFAGVASRQEIGSFYERADIFVNGSNLDNMPVSVLEAFAAGTPVVTTEPEGMKYIVAHGRTGLLSPIGDSGSLARNVLRLLREPEVAAQLGRNAYRESSQYRWPAVRHQWLAVYEELAPKPARRERSPVTTAGTDRGKNSMLSGTEKVRHTDKPAMTRGGTAPVFVVGCPRSGTTVLYHMLLSAGGFAVYRSETNVFNLLVPRFGGMRSREDRERMMAEWCDSILFDVSGLDADRITQQVVEQVRGGGDFLRLVMGEVSRRQEVSRWADCTPEHLLYMEEIKREIPDARFLHIIRDGRDVALSYLKQGWAYPLPWDRGQQLGVAGLYWSWIVGRGRELGRRLGSSYQEVRFEELVLRPRETLERLGKFIDHDLDYETIQRVGIGSVSEPNTSFGHEPGAFDPVERWRTKMSATQVADLEALVGEQLEELGYPLAAKRHGFSLRTLRMRATYFTMFATKQWMKTNTPLGRRVKLGRIHAERVSGRGDLQEKLDR